MISRRVYLLLTTGLLLLSVGTGFAMQTHQSHREAAVRALQAAKFQLDKIPSKSPEQAQAMIQISQVIQSLQGDMNGN